MMVMSAEHNYTVTRAIVTVLLIIFNPPAAINESIY